MIIMSETFTGRNIWGILNKYREQTCWDLLLTRFYPFPVLSISPHFYIIEVHNIISHFSLSYLYSASLLFSGFPSRPTCFYLCVLLRWLFSVVLWDFWKFCFRHLNGTMEWGFGDILVLWCTYLFFLNIIIILRFYIIFNSNNKYVLSK